MAGMGLKVWGLVLLVAGLIGIVTYYVFANNMTTADMLKLSTNRAALNMLPVWFYGSIASAIAGFMMWLVGVLIGALAPGGNANAQAGGRNDWQYRRIVGRMVYYKQSSDGQFSVSIDGAQKDFSSYGELEDFVRSYKPWKIEVEPVSGKSYKYRMSVDGTVDFRMYDELRTFADAAEMRDHIKAIARSHR